jgi:hypothetical protein
MRPYGVGEDVDSIHLNQERRMAEPIALAAEVR